MDADRFDALLRALSQTPSRRGIGRALAGFALGGALGPVLGLEKTEAHNRLKKCRKIEDKSKRKRCVKKARKHNREHERNVCIASACPMGPASCGPAGSDCLCASASPEAGAEGVCVRDLMGPPCPPEGCPAGQRCVTACVIGPVCLTPCE